MSATLAKPRMRSVLERVNGGRVLHVGCAGAGPAGEPDGQWLHGQLRAVADELVGVDIDADAVQRLQARGYDARLDDATELATVAEPVETVVATEVIEHLSNPGGLFEASADVVADGGELLVTTPNPWAACYIRRVAFGGDPVGNDEHTCWIDATTLRELATRHGWRGPIEHLGPMSGGVTAVCRRLGHERLGSTRLLGAFEYRGESA